MQFTEQEMMTMPIKVLRGLDVQDPTEQDVVQRIVDRRMANMPVEHISNNRSGVPDINNQEEEARWQAEIERRSRNMRPIGQVEAMDEMRVGQTSFGEEVVQPMMDDEGVLTRVGDPLPQPDVAPEPEVQPEVAPEPQVAPEPELEPQDVVPDLTAYSREELKAYAKQKGVKVPNGIKKADLLNLLK